MRILRIIAWKSKAGRIPSPLVLALHQKRRPVLATIAAEAFALSLLHHLKNFWDWPLDKQVIVVLVLAPTLGLFISWALAAIWDPMEGIPRSRWLLFAVPAAFIAGIAAWSLLRMPEVRHVLIIAPEDSGTPGAVRIREIRAGFGKVIPLADFAGLPGWELQDGVLKSAPGHAAPIQYVFHGPVGEQVRLGLITGPDATNALIRLDDQATTIDLSGPRGNERRARLITQFKWGLLNFLIAPVLIAVDTLAVFCVLAGLWCSHELGVCWATRDTRAGGQPWTSHVPALVAVGLLALALHVVNASSIAFAVSDDGESYIQGAVHLATQGNLDGTSSYRGLGITVLLGPVMYVFGRDPWGPKILMHSLAWLSVPLAYLVGWRLSHRRWISTAAATFAALSPDLYSYSNRVLSEVPDVFVLLLFWAVLIPALRTPSRARIVAAFAAACFAVLIRPDNLAALGITSGALVLLAIAPRVLGIGGLWLQRRLATRLSDVAIGVAVAALPLLAWSAHNARLHHFFGISNYGGEVLFAGWVYFGEGIGEHILDPNSPAVQAVDRAIPILDLRGKGPPMSWQAYHKLVASGYESNEAFALLGRAAVDSILANPDVAARIAAAKVRQTIRPAAITPDPDSERSLSGIAATRTAKYLDPERGLQPQLFGTQGRINAAFDSMYPSLFSMLFGWGLVALWLSFYRSPVRLWGILATLVVVALLLPVIAELANWRYLIPGVFLMTMLALADSDNFVTFLVHYIARIRGATP